MNKPAVQLYSFDPAAMLDSPEAIHISLTIACDDPEDFDARREIQVIAKAIGLQIMARTAGVQYGDLVHALTANWNDPAFDQTLSRVIETYCKEPVPL